MSKIVAIHDKSNIKKAWDRTFKSDNPFSIPFQPEIEACLFFPFTRGSCLAPVQYRAVTEAARALGERGFVLEETETYDSCKQAQEWWCEFPTYKDYRSLLSNMLENAMYSMDLSWGAIVLHDWHALVGGSKDFISHVDQIYPTWRNEVIELIDRRERTIKETGMWVFDLLIELLEYWKKYPGDEWVETVAAKLNHKLTGGFDVKHSSHSR